MAIPITSLKCGRCGGADHRTRDCLGGTRTNVRHTEISSFEAKRDHWQNFDAADFEKVAAEFEEEDRPTGQSVQSEISVEMRTLRQRSDIAGYLKNGVTGNYNPKTRSLVSDATEFVRSGADQVSRLRTVASDVGKFSDVANPTEAEILFRIVEQRNLETIEQKKRKLADMYSTTEISDHSQVWGSFFDRKSQRWGYACCHSLSRSDRQCSA